MDDQKLQTMLLILRLRPKVALQLNPISVIAEANMFCLGSMKYYVKTNTWFKNVNFSLGAVRILRQQNNWWVGLENGHFR